MTPHVQVARDTQLETVSELLAAFRDWLGYDGPSFESITGTVSNLLGDPSTEFLLGAPAGAPEPAGICQVRYRLSVWTGVDDCWLEDLYVREDARGSGIGTALVEACIRRAKARGCRRIELDVNEQNAGALEFYRRIGFTTEPKPPGRTLFLARALDRA